MKHQKLTMHIQGANAFRVKNVCVSIICLSCYQLANVVFPADFPNLIFFQKEELTWLMSSENYGNCRNPE